MDIQSIHERNARVEADKAWETSKTRRAFIALGTYLIVGAYLNFLGVADAWLHAVVPMMGYVLSTVTLGWAKMIWIQKVYK